MKALSFLETYFLANLRVTGVYHFRARLLVKFTVVSIFFALGYLVNTYFTGFLAARYGMIIVTGFFVIQLFMLRRVSDQWWVAQFFILICWFTVALLTVFSGGITSYVLPWLTLIPVLGLEIQTVRPLMDSILMNLISNAVKYRHPDRVPTIAVRSRREGGEICLTVSDNGLGMDLDSYGDKLFTLYGRFHSHVDGKGLGLYLVKTHVQAMGGRIEVASEPGKGTTFSVFFKG